MPMAARWGERNQSQLRLAQPIDDLGATKTLSWRWRADRLGQLEMYTYFTY